MRGPRVGFSCIPLKNEFSESRCRTGASICCVNPPPFNLWSNRGCPEQTFLSNTLESFCLPSPGIAVKQVVTLAGIKVEITPPPSTIVLSCGRLALVRERICMQPGRKCTMTGSRLKSPLLFSRGLHLQMLLQILQLVDIGAEKRAIVPLAKCITDTSQTITSADAKTAVISIHRD